MERLSSASEESDAFVRRWQVRIGAASELSFADFMELALYDTKVGFYTARRRRTGLRKGTDFYTATNLGRVFGPLVAAAVTSFLGANQVRSHVFLEIGAEPGRHVLEGFEHIFCGMKVIRMSDPVEIPPRAIVFSNELFDAQPFHRVVFRGSNWHELGVRRGRNGLQWTELTQPSPEIVSVLARLPSNMAEGYVIDLPLRAVRLLEDIVAQPWRGLFLAFDYGRTWPQLIGEFPEGTGRAYALHRSSRDLLKDPGNQDITCHVCWDWLEAALSAAGFSVVKRQSKEAFFLQHATQEVERLMASDPDPLSLVRTQLKHLLHPALMGQKFEALWALRP